jgi:hypothetical protein
VPDHGVEGEEALQDAGPETGGDAGVVVFEAELVLEGPDDCFDALPRPVREGAWCFLVAAGRADEGEVQAGEEVFDLGELPLVAWRHRLKGLVTGDDGDTTKV